MRAAAFMTRSIRQDSRTISHHLMRAAVAAFILFLFATMVYSTRLQVGAGGDFAAQVFNCCYWFLTLLGGVHFSVAISEEKEEQTLPLLKMTGASSFAILLGKSLPRLAVTLLFLLCVAPFLMLSVTLGGVLMMGLISSIVSVLCYSLMLSQIGLLASVIASDSRRAFSLMTLFWFATELLWLWVMLIGELELISKSTYQTWYDQTCSWSLIWNLKSTLLAFSATDWWFPHMAFELVVSLIAFSCSLLLFNRFSEERSSSTGASGWVPNLLSANHTSRAWDRALEWKTWHVLTGGSRWALIRAVVGTVLSFGIVSVVVVLIEGKLEFEAIFVGSFWVAVVIFLLSVGRMVGRVFQTEIQQKTLSTLVMLPNPARQTFLSVLKGLLPGMLASFVPVVIGFVAMMMVLTQHTNSLNNIFEILGEPWAWHVFSWALSTLALATYLSTRVRHGALLIAIGLLWFIGPMFFGIFAGLVIDPVFGSGSFDFFRYVIPLGLIFVELLFSVVLIGKACEHLEVLAGR